MKVSTQVTSTFNCTIERAFKAPILGDATQFLNGYLFQPAVIRFEDDATWGEIGGKRYPVIKGNFLMKEHIIATDTILQRTENEYWSWELTDFTTSLLFFTIRGIGEWNIKEMEKDQIYVVYKYTYYSKNFFYHLFNWLFVKIQLNGMMRKAIQGIKKQAESQIGFYYE